jgi:hypothetical protein
MLRPVNTYYLPSVIPTVRVFDGPADADSDAGSDLS